jgi:hypothetical protein
MRYARTGLSLLVAALLALAGTAGAAPPPPEAALDWARISAPEGTGPTDITYAEGRFVAVGGPGAILASDDGQTWRLVHQEPSSRIPGVGAVPGYATPDLHAVAYGGGRWVAVGKPWFLVLTSADGQTWDYSYQWTGVRINGNRELVDVAYGGGRFVAVGNDSAGPTGYIITSADGVQWSERERFDEMTLNGVVFDGNRFLAYGAAGDGQRGAIWTSADGEAWAPVAADLPPLQSLAYQEGRFVASGRPEGDIGTTLFTSADGTVWRRLPTQTAFWVERVTATGGYFFALGGGLDGPSPLAFSKDGEHWMRAETPLGAQAIVSGDDKLVATGWGSTFLTLSPCGSFLDLPAEAPACGAVRLLTDRQVIAGYPDGSFRPQGVITRAEFAKMLSVAMGWSPLPAVPPAFADTAGHWAAEMGYLQAVAAARAIAGYPDGTFRPNAPVTRAELIQMVTGAAGLAPGAPGETYADVAAADWYGSGVGAGLEVGLIGPGASAPVWTGPSFSPDRQVTRAEAAMVLSNLVGLLVR